MKEKLLYVLLIPALSGFCGDFLPLFRYTGDKGTGDPSGSPYAFRTGILASRYGYWRFQPVKMAYLTVLAGKKVPGEFQIRDLSGRIVFRGQPLFMRDPENVYAPVSVSYPGERIFALDFTAFNRSGRYYITAEGYVHSAIFTIGGPLPVPWRSLPDLRTFEQESGILPPHFRLNPVKSPE